MALFRDGVKIGNKDIRTGISKKRGQGILRKLGVLEDDKGRKKFEKDARGEMQAIRTLVGKAEGFQFPVNFKVSFGMPTGIEQPKLDQAAHQEKSQMGTHNVEAKYGGNNKGQITGTITDGDIRRALIKHLEMDCLVKQVMNDSPETALSSDTPDLILSKMKSRSLLHIPIVDENSHLLGIVTNRDLRFEKDMSLSISSVINISIFFIFSKYFTS